MFKTIQGKWVSSFVNFNPRNSWRVDEEPRRRLNSQRCFECSRGSCSRWSTWASSNPGRLASAVGTRCPFAREWSSPTWRTSRCSTCRRPIDLKKKSKKKLFLLSRDKHAHAWNSVARQKVRGKKNFASFKLIFKNYFTVNEKYFIRTLTENTISPFCCIINCLYLRARKTKFKES